MRIIVMGCGRVGSDLAIQLSAEGHDVRVVDRDPKGRRLLPTKFTGQFHVGNGYNRAVLSTAGIEQADAFVAVTSGDNSNIVAARVARETYQVPTVIARIYDPRRADIYERLNITTVATTKWGVKQIQMMLLHDRTELRESLGGGDLLRMRVPVPAHLVGKSATSINVDGKILVGGISRGGGGFIPTSSSMLQEGDYLAVIMAKDGMDLLDEQLAAPDHGGGH